MAFQHAHIHAQRGQHHAADHAVIEFQGTRQQGRDDGRVDAVAHGKVARALVVQDAGQRHVGVQCNGLFHQLRQRREG
ncbi:hypothetical protein D3C72_1338850 [compost metagenome]